MHSKKWSITKYSATLWVKVYALGILAQCCCYFASREFFNPSIIFQVKLVICTFRNDGLSRIWPLCKKRKFVLADQLSSGSANWFWPEAAENIRPSPISRCQQLLEFSRLRLVTLLSAKLHYYLNYLQLLHTTRQFGNTYYLGLKLIWHLSFGLLLSSN